MVKFLGGDPDPTDPTDAEIIRRWERHQGLDLDAEDGEAMLITKKLLDFADS